MPKRLCRELCTPLTTSAGLSQGHLVAADVHTGNRFSVGCSSNEWAPTQGLLNKGSVTACRHGLRQAQASAHSGRRLPHAPARTRRHVGYAALIVCKGCSGIQVEGSNLHGKRIRWCGNRCQQTDKEWYLQHLADGEIKGPQAPATERYAQHQHMHHLQNQQVALALSCQKTQPGHCAHAYRSASAQHVRS